MVVDFQIRKAPAYRLATSTLRGSWPEDRTLRSEFEKVSEWAKGKGIKTESWLFREFSGRRWEVGVEIRASGPVRGDEGISIVSLPSSTVASVTFDPDQISPRVIYHGITDWLRWRRKEGEYRVSGPYREVYQGNPWKSEAAWAHTQIQVPVKKL